MKTLVMTLGVKKVLFALMAGIAWIQIRIMSRNAGL